MQVSEMQRAGKGDNNIHRSVVLTLFQHSVKFLSLFAWNQFSTQVFKLGGLSLSVITVIQEVKIN